MVVCNCNYLTSTDISRACEKGYQKVDAVFSCFSKKERCGQCIPEIKKYIASQTAHINPKV
ncbi:MAG: (2Fe-2S)-binding protein [Rhodospirillales bacterium]|nr:(2Fe-2S)-binding protein [Rhodospirillales bacterium]